MSLWGDDRAASVQIGAVLLFGILILWVTLWQVQVVPQQNASVEYAHSQQVQDDMKDVRTVLVSAPGERTLRSVSVDMAPQYPVRSIFVNPGPPSGTVRTVGTTDAALNVTVENATATDGAAADFWNGTARPYNTGGVAYDPGYNVYTSAPDTVYENTVLYNARDDGTAINVSGQDVVDGRTVTLVVLNGSLSRTTSDAVTVDFEALSTSGTAVTVTNATGDGNVTVSFASQRGAGWWTAAFEESEELLADGGHVVDVTAEPLGDGFSEVGVELEGNVTYELRMAKVGVGSGQADAEPAYAVDVSGDGTSVQQGNTRQLVVEVRDAYNNPVSGVTVANNTTGSDLQGGSLDAESKRTGSDGRVTFEYDATGASRETARPRFNVSDDVTPLARELVTFNVTVTSSGGGGGGGGGGGAYNVTWTDPAASSVSGCGSGTCTWDVGADGDSKLDLDAFTDPTVENLTVSFQVSNSSVGNLSNSDTTTDTNGDATTTLNAVANGTITVYVTAGSASDAISIDVTNVTSGGPTDGTPPAFDSLTVTTSEEGNSGKVTAVEFDYAVSDDRDLKNVTFVVLDSGGTVLDSSTVSFGSTTAENGIETLAAGGTRDVTIRAVVSDDAANFEACERTLVNGANTFTKGDFSCTTGTG
jgi:hypothetical protein